MNNIKTFLAVTMALMSAVATAAKVPTGGPSDYRVRYINYSKYEVINLFVHYGYSTHIEFAPGEIVENIGIGDPAAWHLSPVGNHLFIKPKEKKAMVDNFEIR